MAKSPDPVFGFRSRRIAEGLAQQYDFPTAERQIHGLILPSTKFQVDRHYMLEAKADIPAANNANIDEPGAGIAYIMQRNPLTAAHELTYWLVDGEKVEVLVFNPTTEIILAHPTGETSFSRFLCVQDMDGDLWIAKSANTSTIGLKVQFVITDIYRGIGLNCNAVEAVVQNVSCGASWPLVGDEIIVWDSLGCRFNCPMDLLIGVRGYAERMTTPPADSELGLEQFASGPQPERPCRWEVDELCCVEENV